VRVARLHGAGDIRIGDEPVPEAGPGETLVQVTAVGICGSDLHWWHEGELGGPAPAQPLVLGHEAAGVIAAGPRRGQLVAIDPAIPCTRCRPCRDGYRNLCTRIRFAGHGATDTAPSTDGALREFMNWPSRLLHPLPDTLCAADGAMLEPLGVAVHSFGLGHLPLGGSAAVVGCGPLGLLIIQLLRAAQAGFVLAVEPLAHRQEAAAVCGADKVVSAADLDPPLPGVDVAFDAAGTEDAVGSALECVRPGGRVVLAGIPGDDTTTFRASLARRKGLTIALVRRMNETYPQAISLATRGAVDLASLVTKQVGLADTAAAFDAAQQRTGLKVIIQPAGQPA
jgi:L-iditol 2-dehydrogenase